MSVREAVFSARTTSTLLGLANASIFAEFLCLHIAIMQGRMVTVKDCGAAACRRSCCGVQSGCQFTRFERLYLEKPSWQR